MLVQNSVATILGMAALSAVLLVLNVADVQAHHVLGRPSYSLGADSNTPPSMQVETQIGHYYVTYMAFPAFPKPNEPGRVALYATHIDSGLTFNGDVTFKVRDDSWFEKNEEVLGIQKIDDNVYRQGFEFSRAGDYIITAEFHDQGEPYTIDFPLRIGEPKPVGLLGAVFGFIALVLMSVNVMQRKRRLRLQAERRQAGP